MVMLRDSRAVQYSRIPMQHPHPMKHAKLESLLRQHRSDYWVASPAFFVEG
jgi:hypothetical protein